MTENPTDINSNNTKEISSTIQFDPNDFSSNDIPHVTEKDLRTLKNCIRPTSQKLATFAKMMQNLILMKSKTQNKITQDGKDSAAVHYFLLNNCPHAKDCPCNSNCLHCASKYLISDEIFFSDENPYMLLVQKSLNAKNKLTLNDIIVLSENSILNIPLLNCQTNVYISSPDIKASIFRYILSSLNKKSNKIIYGTILDMLHLKVSVFLADKQLAENYAQNNSDPAIAIQLTEKKLDHIVKYCYSMNSSESNHAKDLDQLMMNEFLKVKKQPLKKEFHKLAHLLLHLTNASPENLKKLSILFAKIIMGRKLLKSMRIEKNSTFIFCNNPQYLQNFFLDVFTTDIPRSVPKSLIPPNNHYIKPNNQYCHITTLSSKDLSNPNNLLLQIHNKIIGNILNVDAHSATGDTDILSKLIKGFPLSVDDRIAHKLTYRSNSHYIFLRNTPTKIEAPIIEISDTIDFSTTPLQTSLYEPLNFHEKYFLITGFVEYGINLLLSEDTVQTTPINYPVETFIKDYCIITTTENDFEHLDIIYDKYISWRSFQKQPSETKPQVRDIIKGLYPYLEYKKKKTPQKDAMAFFNLKFNAEKFENDIKKLQENMPTPSKSKEDFLLFLSDILENNFPHNS